MLLSPLPAKLDAIPVEWRPKIAGVARDMHFNCLVTPAAMPDAPWAIVAPGFGEYNARVAAKVIEVLGAKGVNAAVPIIPYQKANPAHIEWFAHEALPVAAEALNAHRGAHSKLLAHSNSLGGLWTINGAAAAPELFDCVAAISPFNLNTELIRREHRNARILARLIVLNSIQTGPQGLLDKGNRDHARGMILEAAAGLLTGTLLRQLSSAAKVHEATKRSALALQQSGEQSLNVIVGRQDKVHTQQEFAHVLGENNITVVDGPHATLLSKTGVRHLEMAADLSLSARGQLEKTTPTLT